MKRFLLALVFIIELVATVVLYFSFPQIMGWEKTNGSEKQPILNPPLEQTASLQLLLQQSNNQTEPSHVDTVSVAPPFEQTSQAMLSYFAPLREPSAPPGQISTDAIIDLGRLLFYDTRLSVNGELSCNSCHLLDQYGVDGKPLSLGHDGTPTKRNSPTVYNAALHQSQFWDGRSPTVEEQAIDPILASAEMGMLTAEAVVERLSAIAGYEQLFQAAFPESNKPITLDNVATAIGAFERKLITPSRFDRYLNGEWNQLDETEVRGLQTFVKMGCIECHLGPAIGGELFKKMGQAELYPTEDQGRYAITRAETDRQVFKVPSLRNVAETGPYLHDGTIDTLPSMVALMARYQLGKTLSDGEISDIVAFLQSLTGDLPMEYIVQPVLP